MRKVTFMLSFEGWFHRLHCPSTVGDLGGSCVSRCSAHPGYARVQPRLVSQSDLDLALPQLHSHPDRKLSLQLHRGGRGGGEWGGDHQCGGRLGITLWVLRSLWGCYTAISDRCLLFTRLEGTEEFHSWRTTHLSCHLEVLPWQHIPCCPDVLVKENSLS